MRSCRQYRANAETAVAALQTLVAEGLAVFDEGKNSYTLTPKGRGGGERGAQDTAQDTTQDTIGAREAGGDSADSAVADQPAASPAYVREGWCAATNRWRREGREAQADAFRTTVKNECLRKGMSVLDAKEHAWETAIATFPPLPKPELESKSVVEPEVPPAVNSHIRGLGAIPAGWPTLPPNASLQAEVGWVQAHRLSIVEEQASGSIVVHLERASIPAPSMASLGWLETSIRSYAKYIDVVARSLATAQDEQAQVRRERMRIDEIRALLTEMDTATTG